MDESKQDRRVQFTKMFLKDALLELMKEKPIGKITPTELCRKANINRNTFYAHYQSPHELLSEIEEELFTDIIGCVKVYSYTTMGLNYICKAIKDHAELCKVILSDYGDRDFLIKIIEAARDMTVMERKKQSPEVSDEIMDYYFNYCANGSVAVIRDWVCNGMKMSHEEVAQILESANIAVLEGICKNKK